MHTISFGTSVDQDLYNSGANSLCIWGKFALKIKMIDISNAAIKKESDFDVHVTVHRDKFV
jgi:hypothetical protein